MRSYGAARSYFSILEFLSWCIIVLGGLVAIGAIMTLGQMSRSFGGSPMAGLAGLIPGASVMFAGFMGLVLAQIGRAGVDSAEYGQQSLKTAREELEISKQALKQGAIMERGYAALQAAKEELKTVEAPTSSGYASAKTPTKVGYADKSSDIERPTKDAFETIETLEYKGRSIAFDGQYYRFAKMTFANLDAAKAYVNQLGVNETPKLGGATRS